AGREGPARAHTQNGDFLTGPAQRGRGDPRLLGLGRVRSESIRRGQYPPHPVPASALKEEPPPRPPGKTPPAGSPHGAPLLCCQAEVAPRVEPKHGRKASRYDEHCAD